MENKIFIEINCPGCGATIRLGKAADAGSLNFRCPNCRKIIHATFDITTTPQRVEVGILTPEQLKQMQLMQQVRKQMQQPVSGAAVQQPEQRVQQQVRNETVGANGVPRNPVQPVQPVQPVNQQGAKAQPIAQPLGQGGGMNNTIYGNKQVGNIPKPVAKKPLQPHRTTPAMRGLSLVRQSLLFWNKVSYPLIMGHNYIGRRNGNIRPDISIDEDDCISRGKSVDLEICPGGPGGMTMTVKVIHSSNDVVINGSARLRDNQSMEVRIGDTLKIGKTSFKIEKQD